MTVAATAGGGASCSPSLPRYWPTSWPGGSSFSGSYWGFNKDFIFSATGSAGYIEGWGGDNIRINDRFYKGGSSFRGSTSCR